MASSSAPSDGTAETMQAAPVPPNAASAAHTPIDALPPVADIDEQGPTVDPATPTPLAAPGQSGDQLPLQSWERYRILSFLGAGGMGTVYKARDPRLRRSVAIKFLRGGPAENLDTRQRRHFEREARAQAGIDHPHICKIYDVGEVQGQPFIVMQYIQGSSLAGLQQAMSREEKVRAIQRVAEALHAAHSQNLIHRDIKPGNIMVERRPDGSFWPYLMDFGLAREVDSNTQTSTGGVEGTPAYMAPEQARGETRLLDRRTDVYGLGATLYSVLAGRPPFVGNSTDVLLAVLLEDPPRLSTFDPAIPTALETIGRKCLEKNPKRRYASAQELAEDLGRFLDGQRIAARPPSLLHRAVRFSQRHKLIVASVATALVATLILGGLMLRIRIQAAAQARLAQRLGQEITQMEWLLRSARQLPLHDLNREKVIVRRRMAKLQSELASYGQSSRGLAHYALGRGHMALHEYPEALSELQAATALGVQSPEAHYALGIVLGKHFEHAMYEARLSGGGDWAQKQLKQLEPKYLTPTIAALERSRGVQLDAPEYLEALIAFYQRDYDRTLKQAGAALVTAPWLYEAAKLAGDVHLERALQTRDRGAYEEAEKEFAAAVTSYEAAAAAGQSDSEVYEGLAEVWIRHLEMTRNRNLPIDNDYKKAIKATDQIIISEPQQVSGPLKKAFAAMISAGNLNSFGYSEEKLTVCISSAESALNINPGNAYATEVASGCHAYFAELTRQRGGDPTPGLYKATALLEPIIQKNPNFLWGINDLGINYLSLGSMMAIQGNKSAVDFLQKALLLYARVTELDPDYAYGISNSINVYIELLNLAKTTTKINEYANTVNRLSNKCRAINKELTTCINTELGFYAAAASRIQTAKQDPAEYLDKAIKAITVALKFGPDDAYVHTSVALTRYESVRHALKHSQDASVDLHALQTSIDVCLSAKEPDVTCHRLAAQAEWVRAEGLAARGQPVAVVRAVLQEALTKAKRATDLPEKSPSAWQVLAETHLRLAQAAQTQPAERAAQAQAGLAALDKLFAINPNHAEGHITLGALKLFQARGSQDPAARGRLAGEAAAAAERALTEDPLLKLPIQALLQSVRELAQAPTGRPAPSAGR